MKKQTFYDLINLKTDKDVQQCLHRMIRPFILNFIYRKAPFKALNYILMTCSQFCIGIFKFAYVSPLFLARAAFFRSCLKYLKLCTIQRLGMFLRL